MILRINFGLYCFFLLFLNVHAQPYIQHHRSRLGLGTPPSEPDLDEISGPFELKFEARFDDLSRNWQRIFDFGRQLNSDDHDTISLAAPTGTTNLRFIVNGEGEKKELYAYSVIEEGVLTEWTVGVDETRRTYIKKNGVEVASLTDGVWPDAVERMYKYIGRSLWDADDDLLGAVLGLQFVKGGTSSNGLPLQWMNFPCHTLGRGFVVTGYARYDDLSSQWQRIFDFGNGPQQGVINFGQRQGRATMRLEVDNRANGGSWDFLDAPSDIIVLGEWAFWEVGIHSNGTAWISKNGVVLNSDADFPVPGNIFRRSNLFGYSNSNTGDDPLRGAILGVRVDLE